MRSMLRSLVLVPAILCATAALASDGAVVNVPFNFEAQGKAFPAGKYSVLLDKNENVMTLRSVAHAGQSIEWAVAPTEANPDATVSMKFDGSGSMRTLHSVQIGTRTTSVLDAPARSHDAGSSVAAASGQ
jgi:hypothetical protein